jgi:hypothetical protein
MSTITGIVSAEGVLDGAVLQRDGERMVRESKSAAMRVTVQLMENRVST